MVFDLTKHKTSIDVNVDALIEEFKYGKIDIGNLHYLLFDEKIAYDLLEINPGKVWSYLPKKFKSKREFVLLHTQVENYNGIDFLFKEAPEFLSDKEIVVNLLKYGNVCYVGEIFYIDKKLLTSPEFVLENIEYNSDLYTLYDDYILIHKNGGETYSSRRKKIDNSNVRSNFEITLKAVSLYGYKCYQFASEELKCNPEILKALLEKEPKAYHKLSDLQKNSLENIEVALKGDSGIFEKLDEENRNSFNSAIIAVKDDPTLFNKVSKNLRSNPVFVEKAFKAMNEEEKRENVFFITDVELAVQYFGILMEFQEDKNVKSN